MQIYPLFFIIFQKKSINFVAIVCDQLSILLIIGQVFIHIYWRYLNTITISILKMFFFTISKNLSEACSIFCVNPDSDFTRNKIRLEVFKNLFDGSNKKTFTKKLYHGYRILAINDSVLSIDNTIFDDETTELMIETMNPTMILNMLYNQNIKI